MERGGSIEADREAPSRSPRLGSNVVVFPPPIDPAGALGLVLHLLRHPSAVWIPGTQEGRRWGRKHKSKRGGNHEGWMIGIS